MAIETRRPLGLRGLNLSGDESQVDGLVVADGARYDKVGAIYGRFGRKRLELEFPQESLGNPDDYVTDSRWLYIGGDCRGFAEYYDRRIWVDTPENLANGSFAPNAQDLCPEWTSVKFAFNADYEDFRYQFTGVEAASISQFAGSRPNTAPANTLVELTISLRSFATGFDLSGLSSVIVSAPFASGLVTVPPTLGTHRVQFLTSATAATDTFTVLVNSTSTAYLAITDVSLRAVRDDTALLIPERLNFWIKTGGRVVLNDLETTWLDADGSMRTILAGDNTLAAQSTRAKFVGHGESTYVIDESTRPKIIRPLPAKDQDYLKRVKYEITDASLEWPTDKTAYPQISFVGTVGGGYLDKAGIFRVRVCGETKYGDITNPSLPGTVASGGNPEDELHIDWSHMIGDIPDVCTKVRVYLQWSVAGSDLSVSPSDFKLIFQGDIDSKSNAADNAGTFRLHADDFNNAQLGEPMSPFRGHAPILSDFIIINNIGYGISMPDVIYREDIVGEGSGRNIPVVGNALGPYDPGDLNKEAKLYENTKIFRRDVQKSFLFISKPGEPMALDNWIRLGRGTEYGVGLAELGDRCVIFTNKGILSYDPAGNALHRIPGGVGALSRDSIQAVENLILFLGTDGIPRVFNGATVESTAMELYPIFAQEDHSGVYEKFDPGRVYDVSTASGDRKFWMSYPVSSTPGTVPPTPGIVGGRRNLAIADLAHHTPRWSIDTRYLEELRWLGRESRLSAVDEYGAFYWLEEGFVDTDTTPTAPPFSVSVRWFGDGISRRYHKFRLDIDTKGQDVSVTCQVDEKANLTQTYTVNTDGRDKVSRNLPGTFKGQYLDVRIFGSTHETAGRPILYDVKVESTARGVFG